MTNIYLKEGAAIVSSSLDGLIRVTTLSNEFDDMTVDPQEFEISAFTLRQSFNPSKFELFIGTLSGKLFYYYNGWFQNTKEIIHNKEEEG